MFTRPSGPPAHPDPAPILTKDIPVQQVPDIDSRVRVGRYAGTFRPDPDAVVLAEHRATPTARTAPSPSRCPQGTLITSLSLNPTNDTLASLRKVELIGQPGRAPGHGRRWSSWWCAGGCGPCARWRARPTPSPRAT